MRKNKKAIRINKICIKLYKNEDCKWSREISLQINDELILNDTFLILITNNVDKMHGFI